MIKRKMLVAVIGFAAMMFVTACQPAQDTGAGKEKQGVENESTQEGEGTDTQQTEEEQAKQKEEEQIKMKEKE